MFHFTVLDMNSIIAPRSLSGRTSGITFRRVLPSPPLQTETCQPYEATPHTAFSFGSGTIPSGTSRIVSARTWPRKVGFVLTVVVTASFQSVFCIQITQFSSKQDAAGLRARSLSLHA
jgi:hypothetical protein